MYDILFIEAETFGPGAHRNILQAHSPHSPQLTPRTPGSIGYVQGQVPGVRPPFSEGNKVSIFLLDLKKTNTKNFL